MEAADKRFLRDAEKYAAYLETPEGKLRVDLTFANLREFLPESQLEQPLRALDIGCGTGACSLRLARAGVHVTLLDSSAEMLAMAGRAARQSGVSENTAVKHGDVADLGNIFSAGSFDIVLCHNVLEYAGDPASVLRDSARLMRPRPSGILSLLVRNRIGEVLKACIQSGDLDLAELFLTAEWGAESLYGGPVRLFTSEGVETTIKEASLDVIAVRGVRVIADYLPPQVSRDSQYRRIFELECKLGRLAKFASVARYVQYLARPGIR
ncbi:MAG TPA: methyltransferase domain-containing protein [Acidobacteriota bacterium]